MSATFTTLFERGRYSSQGRWHGLNASERKQRIEQQERFAVGMIGLAIKHDARFRKHFLGTVCGFDHLPSASGWAVVVEPENWGDLVLNHAKSRWFVVAEFKIGANLANHQNPSKVDFRRGSKAGKCAGYGAEIKDIASREKWTRLKYVTIEKKASWEKESRPIPRLKCERVEWAKFVRDDESKESSIEADVYDSLSSFGVSAFAARGMKKLKLANKATQPLALLLGVLAKFNVEFRSQMLNGEEGSLGFNIYRKDFQGIGDIVDRKRTRPVGWFGYESGEPLGPRCSVWLYCRISKRGRGSAHHQIKKALRQSGFRDKEFCENGSDVGVFCKAADSTGDLEWFTKVLTPLNN